MPLKLIKGLRNFPHASPEIVSALINDFLKICENARKEMSKGIKLFAILVEGSQRKNS